MQVTTIGSPTVSSDLTRAVADMADKAKKQLADTGSLAGFSAEYTGNSGGEQVTISMKALALSFYDTSAKPDDTILAFSVNATAPGFGSVAGGSGSLGKITSSDDIDATANSLDGILKEATTPFTSTSYDASDYRPGGVLENYNLDGTLKGPADGQDPSTAAGANASIFSALQQKQDATSRLVGALQDFLDGLKKSTTGGPSGSQSTQSTLKNMMLRVDIKI